MTTREVVLDGGSPWGFRMHGGADVNQPLRISRVNPGSKAAVKGIREGDLITSISGQNTKGISNSEAHSLLKNAGDSLILGLNEDVSGSPKRRHYNKTIHQETHSETVKKSSITYSIQSSESITSKPETNNEKIANLHNEKNKQQVNGKSSEIQRPKLGTNGFSTDSTSTLTDRDTVRNNSSDFAIASQRSSYTNCTPSPSTASTLTEDGIEARSAMADNNASSSRSRRRRARNNRKKNKNKQCEAMAVDETNCDGKVVETETTTVETKHEVRKKVNYRVDSPEEIEHVVSSKDVTKQTSIIKSKSLDHDEMIRIQELSDASEGENKGDNPAIISEASESEFEWEETDQLDIPQAESGALSSMSLPLEHYHLEEVNLISPEDELKLRNFLEGLNLVNSPEESAKQTYEISTVESIKARKAQKRAALEQYFLPMVNNPRYLDVISEEASDQSDKEVPLIKHHLKQGTPELENPKDDRPPVPVRRHRRQINKSNYQLPNPAILVGTKIVDTEPVISSTIESEPAVTGVQNIMLPETSKVEVVYLSSSESPEALSDNEEEPSSTTCSAESLTSEDSKCDVRPNQNEQLQHNADIITQFTPPPTPENSPKSQGDNTLLNFAENVTMKLKHEDNFSYLQEVAKDERFNLLPDDLKVKVQGALSLPQGALSSHQCTLSSDKPLIPDILSVQSYEEDILRDDVKTPTKNLSVDVKYTNVISPPVPSRSPTPSSEASLSTAKYNPMNSSVGDMSTFTKDDEQTKEIELLQPLTLRESCLKYLISLPFGEAVLEELANVSQSIESFTSRLPSSLLPKVAPNLPAYVYNKQMKDNNSDSSDFPVNSNNQEMPVSNKWVGLPTERDPNVVVYLSPTQRTQLEKSKKVPDEAGKLLDLHEKYLSRKSCDEVKSVDENVKITTINKSNCNISINPPNPPSHRLLAIIREEPSVESLSGESRDSDFLHFKEINPRERVQSATLPRNKFKEPAVLESARLKARDLSEWLQLARHKSMSESNLSSATELKCESPHVSTNNRVHSENNFHSMRRRTSLPQEIFDRQMQYLLEKERDVQRELERLEEEKMKLTTAMVPPREFHPDDYHISRRGDYAVHNENKTRPTSMPAMPTEFFRQQMYEEYMNQIAERQERKQLKVIKMSTSKPNLFENPDASLGEVLHIRGLEEEFMDKVKERKGGASELKEDSVEPPANDSQEEDETPVLVIEGESLKDTKQLPKHLQEFVTITKQASAEVPKGIWSPGQRQPEPTREERTRKLDENETIPPVWTPKSANSSPIVERKEFKPVSFNSPVLSRKSRTGSESAGTPDSANSEPPWKVPEAGKALSTSLEKRLPISQSLTSGFSEFTSTRLPRAQNPTITLLQKAREGQLPRGAHYINQDQGRRLQNERPAGVNPVYTIKNEYVSDSESERPRKIVTLGPRQFQGIGPITKDGMPLILRSEVRDSDQSKWYKKMYDTIHKQKPHQGEYVTVRYKQRRAQYPYSSSGYLSEPEPGAYDSDFTEYKYATLDRRRTPYKERDHDYVTSATMPRVLPNKSSSSTDILRNGKDKPGRIEHYTPGHSSIAEKEAKEWWDEVMDIFDGHLDHQKKVPPPPKSFINQALKESGYESDSTLVFRRKEETAQQLSPQDHKEAYKAIQRGEDVPFHGLRKPAPERPQEAEPPIPPPKGQYLARSQSQESPRKYVENEVTIHYKTPVRQEIKEYLSEDELAHKQAEAMKKIYEEERRRKYLQELQDMSSRRHTDNFIPSEKSPIALNRYDDFDLTPAPKAKQRSPEPRLVAKALYNFVGQTARELTFRKGDLIYVRRQVDKNWYEGELNAMVGLFPVNHVEIVTHDGTKSTARKSYEGQARAKFNFVAQTHLELSLAKGELVIITRKVDNNWYEGKIGGRKGIFPMSYVDVLIDPQEPPPPSSKPVASPASHSILLNGSSGGKDSMGSHSYTPTMASKDLTATTYQAKPIQITGSGTYGSLNRYLKNPIDQALHIETQAEPVPYRALYKYAPQNDDELELMEGDTVFVLEKCDDGWYVGSSDRTGAFGTFPGNYVEKI